MSTETIVLIAVTGPLVLLFLIFGILLWNGKGAFLIAGYNTSSKEEQSKYNEKALCRFVAKLMFFRAVCMLLFALAPVVGTWLMWTTQAVMLIVIIAAVIYANTGNRFKKK